MNFNKFKTFIFWKIVVISCYWWKL